MPQELLIRTSERSKFKMCRQAWKWSYVDHLKPKREKRALAFGTLTHSALELRYPPGKKRGPHPVKCAKKVWTDYIKDGGEEYDAIDGVPADELLIEMMSNYYDEYGDDERYEVIAGEMTFQVDVYSAKGVYLFTYVGTIDGVWRDLWHDTIVFAEHKTGASLEPFSAPIYLDDQQGAYWAYAPDFLRHEGILRPGEEMDHVLYNRLRKAMGDKRPKNADGHSLNKPTGADFKAYLDERGITYKKSLAVADLRTLVADDGQDPDMLGAVSLTQPTPLFRREPVYRSKKERALTMRRVRNEVRDMKLARAGKIGIYKTPAKHCGYCEFYDMCEVHESGSDWQALRDGLFTTWDPYESHGEPEELADHG